MTGPRLRARLPEQGESRRQFFKLLAASPLLGLAYPALPPSWQRVLARESERNAVTRPRPAGVRCADCRVEMAFPASARTRPHAAQEPAGLPPQNALEEQLTGQLVDSPDEAINVWDFERVAHANNLAQHWDYLHMGVDDYETRKANREGFQRLMIRLGDSVPRRHPGSTRRSSSSADDGTRRSSCAPWPASRPITRRAKAVPHGRRAPEAFCRCSRIRARSPMTRSPRREASRTGFRSTPFLTGT